VEIEGVISGACAHIMNEWILEDYDFGQGKYVAPNPNGPGKVAATIARRPDLSKFAYNIFEVPDDVSDGELRKLHAKSAEDLRKYLEDMENQ
jgi:hypothetical protein